MFRLICSLLVALVCVGGYFAFDHHPEASQGSPDASASQQAAPSAPSQDDSQFKDLKVN